MSLSYPSRRGGSSLTLVVTFVLGVLIGAVLFYAVADSAGWDFSARKRLAQAAKDTPQKPEPPKPAPTPQPAPPVEKPAPAEVPAPAPPAPVEPPKPAVPPKVADEEIAKHLMVDVQGTELDEASKELLAAFKPGLVVLRSQNLKGKEQGKKLIADIKAAVGGEGIDGWPLVAIAQEGGEDNPLHVEDAPSAKAIAAGKDFDKNSGRARDVGITYGAAAREWGAGVILAPRLDVFAPGVSDAAIEERSFGTDAQDAADLGNAFQTGLREAGVLSVGTHFPGLGQAVKADDGALTIPLKEIRLLVELLLPFSETAAGGIAGMLVAEARVPGLEQAAPELPAPLSTTMIQTILRKQLGFDGVAIADDITSSPLTSGKPVGEVVAAALATGCDVVYLGALERPRMEQAIAGVQAALAAGTLTEDALGAGATRLTHWREFLKQAPLAKAPKAKVKLPAQPEGTDKEVHRVERGETLEAIAKKYGVSVEDIVTWNAIDDKKIHFAQRLNVYVPHEKPAPPEASKEKMKPAADAPAEPKKAAEPAEKPADAPDAGPKDEKKIETTDAVPAPDAPAEKKDEEKKDAEKKPADADNASKDDAKKADTPPPAKADDKKADDKKAADKPTQLHEIMKGDTLRKLAAKYNTTEAELMKMNKLTSADQILLGTKLKVPKP